MRVLCVADSPAIYSACHKQHAAGFHALTYPKPPRRPTRQMWVLPPAACFPRHQRFNLGGAVSDSCACRRRSVKKRAGFDINEIAPLDAAPQAHVPVFFGHASGDTFVRPHHSERLFEAYSGDKERMVFEHCDHNSPRPIEYYNAAAGFLSRALRVPFEAAMLQSVMSEASMQLPGIEMGAPLPLLRAAQSCGPSCATLIAVGLPLRSFDLHLQCAALSCGRACAPLACRSLL